MEGESAQGLCKRISARKNNRENEAGGDIEGGGEKKMARSLSGLIHHRPREKILPEKRNSFSVHGEVYPL